MHWTLSLAERDKLLNTIDENYQAYACADYRDREKRRRLLELAEASVESYFQKLPRPVFAICPYCGAEMFGTFDPYGFNGIWWNHAWNAADEKSWIGKFACKHFRFLCGAVNYTENSPPGPVIRQPVYPGPEVPFVVPSEIQEDRHCAVISAHVMANGWIAYPIAYFGDPARRFGRQPAPWKSSADIVSSAHANRHGMYYSADTGKWDYDLLPYVRSGRLYWCDRNDNRMHLRSGPPEEFPFCNLRGRREPVTYRGSSIYYGY